jgi:hypothetical protein
MKDRDDATDDVRPFGKASLRYVPGQGWVQVPHLFGVTFQTPSGRKTYRVQTFHGRDKAVAMATAAHVVDGSGFSSLDVEEFGPTPPGGLFDAIDDRAEW